MSHKLFTIIVPSYNRNKEISVLLASLEQQTTKNFDVVIVDDCSPQAVEIQPHFTYQVKVIRNEQNLGAAGSRNVGAENAKTEWLLFLDDDDRFAANKCEILQKAIENAPLANFVYHPACCEMVNEGFSYQTKPYSDVTKLTLDNILLANKVGGMPMIGIKKAFFQQLGGLSTSLKSLEDYEFVLKAVSSPDLNAIYVDEPLSICTFHTKRSSVSTNTQNTEQAIEQIAKQYVKTAEQQKAFAINSLYMLSYPNAMNLSRQAAIYYFKMFKISKNIKHLIIATITFISPKLAINLKRFI